MLKLTLLQASYFEDIAGRTCYSDLQKQGWIDTKEQEEESITDNEVKLIAYVAQSKNSIIEAKNLRGRLPYPNESEYKADCEHLINKGLLIRTTDGRFTLAYNIPFLTLHRIPYDQRSREDLEKESKDKDANINALKDDLAKTQKLFNEQKEKAKKDGEIYDGSEARLEKELRLLNSSLKDAKDKLANRDQTIQQLQKENANMHEELDDIRAEACRTAEHQRKRRREIANDKQEKQARRDVGTDTEIDEHEERARKRFCTADQTSSTTQVHGVSSSHNFMLFAHPLLPPLPPSALLTPPPPPPTPPGVSLEVRNRPYLSYRRGFS